MVWQLSLSRLVPEFPSETLPTLAAMVTGQHSEVRSNLVRSESWSHSWSQPLSQFFYFRTLSSIRIITGDWHSRSWGVAAGGWWSTAYTCRSRLLGFQQSDYTLGEHKGPRHCLKSRSEWTAGWQWEHSHISKKIKTGNLADTNYYKLFVGSQYYPVIQTNQPFPNKTMKPFLHCKITSKFVSQDLANSAVGGRAGTVRWPGAEVGFGGGPNPLRSEIMLREHVEFLMHEDTLLLLWSEGSLITHSWRETKCWPNKHKLQRAVLVNLQQLSTSCRCQRFPQFQHQPWQQAMSLSELVTRTDIDWTLVR